MSETKQTVIGTVLSMVGYSWEIRRVPVVLQEWVDYSGRRQFRVRIEGHPGCGSDYAVRGVAIRNIVKRFAHPSCGAIWSTEFVKAVRS